MTGKKKSEENWIQFELRGGGGEVDRAQVSRFVLYLWLFVEKNESIIEHLGVILISYCLSHLLKSFSY